MHSFKPLFVLVVSLCAFTSAAAIPSRGDNHLSDVHHGPHDVLVAIPSQLGVVHVSAVSPSTQNGAIDPPHPPAFAVIASPDVKPRHFALAADVAMNNKGNRFTAWESKTKAGSQKSKNKNTSGYEGDARINAALLAQQKAAQQQQQAQGLDVQRIAPYGTVEPADTVVYAVPVAQPSRGGLLSLDLHLKRRLDRFVPRFVDDLFSDDARTGFASHFVAPFATFGKTPDADAHTEIPADPADLGVVRQAIVQGPVILEEESSSTSSLWASTSPHTSAVSSSSTTSVITSSSATAAVAAATAVPAGGRMINLDLKLGGIIKRDTVVNDLFVVPKVFSASPPVVAHGVQSPSTSASETHTAASPPAVPTSQVLDKLHQQQEAPVDVQDPAQELNAAVLAEDVTKNKLMPWIPPVNFAQHVSPPEPGVVNIFSS